jgi:putative DNA primase/helicase
MPDLRADQWVRAVAMTERLPAYERVTAAIAEHTGWRPPGERGDWRCPAHADGSPSLSVNRGAKGVVLHCQAGCTVDQVVAALGLRPADLFDQPLERPADGGEWTPFGPAVAVYDYVDEAGGLLFQVLRTADKQFPQRRPDKSKPKGWAWKLEDTRRVLYRLPKVLDAVAAGEPVFVVEGERDVHSIEGVGEVATCNPGGSNKWRDEYADVLAKARVIVVADKDEAGRRHARRVAASLHTVDAEVTVVEAVEGKDVTDHLAAGYTLEQLFVIDVDHNDPPPPPAPVAVRGDEPGPPPKERFTDLGNALRLVREHGTEIRYVGQWGSWLVWDGRRWERDHAGNVHELAKASVASMWRELATIDNPDRREAQAKWAVRSEGAARIEAMVRLARTDPRVAVGPDDLDADPWALNALNGTVDLRTGLLRPHDPAALHTKVASVQYLLDAQAPRFHQFLEAIVPDPDVRVFLQRAVGYSLTGLTTEQVLFFAHGSGANGKSTLFETLLALLGDYGRHSDPELLLAKGGDVHPTGVADLMGARLVVSSEIEEGRRLAEATVKQLTGGDRIKARYMRQDFFEFTPTHKLFLHANHRPIVRGTDHAIWRRLRLVPFTVTIERSDQDPHLAARLEGELPGILNWALAGARDWIHGGLTEPLAVQAASDDYRADMDILGAFLADRCVQFPYAQVTAEHLYRAYTDWCDENGERPITQRRLGMSLTERGFDRAKSTTTRRWQWTGLGLAAEEATTLDPHEKQRDARLPYADD